jgi:hypothetical protein
MRAADRVALHAAADDEARRAIDAGWGGPVGVGWGGVARGAVRVCGGGLMAR